MPEQPQVGSATGRPRGRRAKGEDTREQVLVAAREEFAERGYDAASLRGIARRAGVDPALVRYWFEGGKAELFSTSLMRTQVYPVRIAEAVAAGPIEGFGARLVAAVLDIWEVPGGSERFRLIFAAGVSGQGVDGIRDYLTQEVYARVAKRLDGPDARLRMNLVASQLAGLMVARYGSRYRWITGPTHRASSSTGVDELSRWVGPVIQRYLDPLTEPARGVPGAISVSYTHLTLPTKRIV